MSDKKQGFFGRILTTFGRNEPIPEQPPAVNETPLREAMLNHLDSAELETLCQQLNVDYATLEGGKGRKVSAIVLHCHRRNQLPELLAACQQLKPNVNWQKQW